MEATALHQVSELVLRDIATGVIVTYSEGNVGVEVRITLQVLSCCLSSTLRADQCPEEVLKLARGRVGKDVILPVNVDPTE